MHLSAELLDTPELNYQQWRDMLRPNWGLYSPEDPKGFAGTCCWSTSRCGAGAR
jgi:hypothetical protein